MVMVMMKTMTDKAKDDYLKYLESI